MERSLLEEVVLEQRKDLASLDLGIKREKMDWITRHQKLRHVLVISGIRRVGKSTILAQIIHESYPNQFYYLNFEDERLLQFGVEDFNLLYEIFLQHYGEKKVFFFDEIQNVPKWENFVRRMQDKGCRFFITGSNASLLSKELGAKLTGRSLSLELYPFSFPEFLAYQGYSFKKNFLSYTEERAKIKRHFNEYLKHGGMPEYLKYQEPLLLKRVYEDILYRDIVTRYEVKEVHALRELGLYFFTNFGSPASFNQLKKMLGLGSANTVKSYMDYFENSYLFFAVNRFSYSLKQQFVAPKKIYCIDNGLIEAVAFQFSKNKGKFLENLVFVELKRRGKQIFYYKTKSNLEVDFLIREGKTAKELIQVCANLQSGKTRDREINALLQAMEELNLPQGLILTEDTEEKLEFENKQITLLPIYKWLLEAKLG